MSNLPSCCRIWTVAAGLGVVVLVLNAASCDESEDNAAAVAELKAAVCSGGDDLWIGYQQFIGMGRGGVGEWLVAERGEQFFVIDSSCTFFAFDGTSGKTADKFGGLGDVFVGTLTTEEAKRLVDDLALVKWPSYYGKRFIRALPDCGGAGFFDASGTFECSCGCPDDKTPSAINQAASWIPSILVKRGTPVTGPLRVLSIPHVEGCDGMSSYNLEEEMQDAPASFDPGAIAAPECIKGLDFDPTVHVHLIDGDTAEELREVRKTYRAQLLSQHGDVGNNRIPMQSDEGDLFDIYLFDVIPLEDEAGVFNPHGRVVIE